MTLENLLHFCDLFKNNEINVINQKLNEVFKSYTFAHISEKINCDLNPTIFQNFRESKVVIINQFTKNIRNCNNAFFIISFQRTILIIKQNLISYLQELFSNYPEINFYFLSNTKEAFNKHIKIEYKESNDYKYLNEEISNFRGNFTIQQVLNHSIYFIWQAIQTSIAGFLIKQSYAKCKENRQRTNIEIKSEIIDQDDLIELRQISTGSSFSVFLVYHIEREELYVIKRSYINKIEIQKLKDREIYNYSKISYPLIPKYYGTIKDKSIPIIEYIDGNTLKDINLEELSDNDKYTILFEIICIIGYLHTNKFVYRDLKPNNIIINSYKTAILIDFDRMIEIKEKDNKTNYTNDFSTEFIAPEVNTGIIAYKNDIYSIGQIFYFLFKKHIQDINSNNEIKTIYMECIKNDINERPSILELMFEFYNKFKKNIDVSFIQNDENFNFIKELFYFDDKSYKNEISKNISYYFELISNKNIPVLQLFLGNLFLRGKYVTKNINKSIHYFTLSANNNNPEAQFNLGLTYFEGKYITMNINKSIYYFSLAAKQNISDAQTNLAYIYYTGKHVIRDISKAIYYFTLAADQNNSRAQFNLFNIYINNKYVTRDIKKSIHYLTLAANQKNSDAQLYLGYFYYNGEYVARDINKSIHYFTLAANQNNSIAQYSLGLFYCTGKYVTKDINKSIYYYSLAAKQNNSNAQVNLGYMYYTGEYVTRDINKSIHYFTLAANQNNSIAQYSLGLFYYTGKYVTKDINKSIYYYSLAAKQNNSNAQAHLGYMYYTGEYVTRDINKSIYLLTLAANQKLSIALTILWLIFYNGKYISKDIKKSIYYLTLAANQNEKIAQNALGILYYAGIYVPRDINQSIYYFTLAANQNNSESQFYLGKIYYEGIDTTRDINKAINYFLQSSNNGNKLADFVVGFLYHEGKYVNRDIRKSIIKYKSASTFNIHYAKNNLGILYKNGIPDELSPNIGVAISYFEENIQKNNDAISMYNLSHIYIYHDNNTQRIIKAIELLILLINSGFSQSNELLCIALIKKFGNNLNNIRNELIKKSKSSYFTENTIQLIKKMNLFDKSIYDEKYKYYKAIDYLYDFNENVIVSKELINETEINIKSHIRQNITPDFYEGFGIEIYE